ncbi:hypothetical protein NDU88_001084 [Pleurodeles waltl]|uniref:Uncharacterized protein n=1 Tax=Pleurodeles waltl TaxID=8319 RepID=A0AAV7THK5_PLEWA|nr:hypothetical protein NDU88_001084 [Pleurodeles waltl]
MRSFVPIGDERTTEEAETCVPGRDGRNPGPKTSEVPVGDGRKALHLQTVAYVHTMHARSPATSEFRVTPLITAVPAVPFTLQVTRTPVGGPALAAAS